MKLLFISTNIFPLPPTGYSGLEMVLYLQAVGLAAKGHQVTVVAPQGSVLPEGVELIPTMQNEPEEATWHRYSQRLNAGEFEAIFDHSLDHETPLLVKFCGQWTMEPIGALVDRLLRLLPGREYGGTEVTDLADGLLYIHTVKNGSVVVTPVRQAIRHRARDLFAITASRGHEIKLTGEHAVFEAYGQGWRKERAAAARSMLGKHVRTVSHLPCDATEKPFIPLEGMGTISLTKHLLTFLGLWIGDGSYTGTGKYATGVRMYAGESPELLAVLDDVARQFHGHVAPPPKLRSDVRRDINCTRLHRAMKAAGFTGHSHTKRIPAWIFDLSDAQVGAFLQGYFFADAGFRHHELALVSANRQLLMQTKMLLWRLGIDSSLRPSTSRSGYKPDAKHWDLSVSHLAFERFLETVGWLTPKGQERLKQDAAQHPHRATWPTRSARVQSVSRQDTPEYVYDLGVPDGQRFVAAGMLVHNSWEKWSYVSSSSRDPELPIMGILHSSPGIYATPPPVRWPCLVGLSESHARDQRLHLKVDCKVAYNGVDGALYTPDPSIKRNDHYLFFGRYTAEKNPLGAMRIARDTRVRLDCFGDTSIVGDQSYVERCRQTADGLRVRFNGPVSRQDSLKLYRGAKALLFPLNWAEPFGLVVIEAMLCGLPVITLRRGAMPELVEHGVSGFVYDSEEEIEEAIRKDMVSQLDPAKIRASGERFSVQRMLGRYEELAQDVVAGKGW